MVFHPNLKDITGQRFGRLTVVRYAGPASCGSSWECLCDCGNTSIVRALKLRQGKTQSCGCFRAISASVKNKTHGASDTPEYKSWLHIKRRCYDKRDNMYRLYGARGIRVCERWRRSFEAFLADMGPKPTEAHTVDRFPNSRGDYEPGNCRWATPKEQQRNKSSNRMVLLDGQRITLVEACERLKMNYGTAWNRLMVRKLPWNVVVKMGTAG